MATYCPEDLASRELSCPICFEDYDIQDSRRAPKLLLCLHTFCYDCARKLWKHDGSLECSLCRMLHEEVSLEDLLDNHVIVQHLREEFEMKDLAFAMRIDEEFRQQESIAAPAAASELIQVCKEIPVLEIPDTSSDSVDADIEDQNETVEVGDDTEEEDDDDRHYSLSNFIEDIMEGFAQHEPVTQVSDDDDDDDDDNNGYEEPDVIEEHEAVDEEETDGDHEEEDNTNTFFSFHNIHDLFGQSVEESNEETHNEEENINNMFSVDSDQTVLDMDDNEENDAYDEEDERWHSASDDINVTCWDDDDALPMHDVEDMEDDTPDMSDWHILSSGCLLDD